MNIKKNLLLSFRHLIADRVNTVINIAGLALALGTVTVVLVFVLNEFGYNSSFPKRDRIYRILETSNMGTGSNTPYILGKTLKEQFAEIKGAIHHFTANFEIKQEDGEYIQEKELVFADSDFFNMFDVQIIDGSYEGFDETLGNIYLCREVAAKHFGNESAVGKILTVRASGGSEYRMTVGGVFDNFAPNVTMKAQAIANMKMGFEVIMKNIVTTGMPVTVDDLSTQWNMAIMNGYLLVHEGVDPNFLTEKINLFSKERCSAIEAEWDDDEDELYEDEDESYNTYALQPMSDIYFGSAHIFANQTEQGNLQMIYVLISVGIAILLIACINYLNLTLAQAFAQTKNLAVRKICGATRSNLVGQTVFESVLIAFIALPFATIIAYYLLPVVGRLLEKPYTLTFSSNLVSFLAVIVCFTVFAGIFSGLFISLQTTSFNLVDALKRKAIFIGNQKLTLQNTLVVFQIAVFIVLLSSAFIMRKQISYALTADIGIDKEGLVRIPVKDVNYEVFRQKLLKNPDVRSVSGGIFVPPGNFDMRISMPKVSNPSEMVTMNGTFVDYDFLETMGIQLLSGEDFARGGKTGGVLLNKSAVVMLGLTDVIGEHTSWGEVLGVISDFNITSIHSEIPPLVMGLNSSSIREIAVRINTQNMQETIQFIEQSWKTANATKPFEFGFTDDVLKRFYETDVRFSRLTALLAFGAILIACMGLFGLSLLDTKRRTKEIGIRKINGATVAEVMVMLNRGFIYRVLAAFIIATPVAWLAMQKWLDSFAYRTSVSWWIFALAGMAALAIILLTVSLQSWRSACRNPVEALRYE
ncbi:MAG: ABC transporter permease [Cytophagaceae bacterium]|jgi:putative ABC transport system permease protein|nr:ABC transporter permease [Cytophagaceae bacterium]